VSEGVRRVSNGTLRGWLVNDMPPNARLQRYLARCEAWPDQEIGPLRELGGLQFFDIPESYAP
jgi:hypothetical protein